MLIGIDASRATVSKPTGTETYSRELIRALLRLDRTERFILYTREPVARGFFGSQNNFELRSIPFPRFWTHLRLSAEILAQAPDVLFVPAHVIPPIHPGNSVVTIHDLGHLRFPEAHTRGQLLYHRIATRWNAHAARHILADSESTRDDIVRFCGVDAQKVSIVYPSFNRQVFAPVSEVERIDEAVARFRIGKDYIISIGTVHPRKNYTRLIEAVARLGNRACTLVIVGKKGWLDREIRLQSVVHDIRDRILFLDYVEENDLALLLAGARILAFPSLHEGFGLPILEAQAVGTPVVCSMTSSLPEVAGDGALFVDPCDVDALTAALDRLLVDLPLRSKLIENGFRNVQRYSWDKSAAQVQDIFEQLGQRSTR